ncbi:hypothetical protein L9F63_001804, partial [Diploptera punctata]
CSECDMGFTKIGDLNRHNRGHKTYTCSVEGCGVVLKAWTHMRSHMKLKHPPEFLCEVCGLIFRNMCRLKTHASIHKEKHEKEKFVCGYPNCPRFYYQKSNLTHHIKSSHLGKKFECTYEDCGRQLSSRAKLKQHMKLHTNHPTPRQKRKSKHKRCDAGTHKRSMAPCQVVLKEQKYVESISKHLQNESSTESEGDAIISDNKLSHSCVVVLEKEKYIDSQLKLFQKESSTETENEVETSGELTNTEKTQPDHFFNETVTLVKSSPYFTSPISATESELKETEGDLISTRSKIETVSIPFGPGNKINESDYTSEQQIEYHRDDSSHSYFSKPLNSNENKNVNVCSNSNVDMNISSTLDENSDVSLLQNQNGNTSLNSDDKMNHSSTSVENYNLSFTMNQIKNISLKSSECVNMSSILVDNSKIYLSSDKNMNVSSKPGENSDLSLISDKNVNSNTNINIPLLLVENSNTILISDKKIENMSMSSTSGENVDALLTCDISLCNLNVPIIRCDCLSVESTLDVPLEHENCSSVVYINSDHGTLLEEIGASSADNRKNELLTGDKLQHSTTDDCSERESVEKEVNKKSDDCSQNKLPEDISKLSSEIPKTKKRRIVTNRKMLASYKKLKTADIIAKNSSLSSNNIPLVIDKEKGRTDLCTPEDDRISIDTIYKGDVYIEDCLRVIDTKDLRLMEERTQILDIMRLPNNEIDETDVDRNNNSILESSSSLMHLLSKRKQKSLDQIVDSLHSVLGNKSGINNSCVDNEEFKVENVAIESSEIEDTKSWHESLFGVSASSEVYVGNNGNLKDLCAVSQEAMLEEKYPLDGELACVKQEVWNTKIRRHVTIKKWLWLMQRVMEDILPSIKR